MQKITKFYPQIFNLSFGICAATVKNILRQNKKGALLEFLFGSQDDKIGSTPHTLEETIQNLQNQVNSLQERVIHLENQILVKDGNLNVPAEATKTPISARLKSQQYNSLNPK